MPKERTKQIPEQLYVNIIKFFLLEITNPDIEAAIRKGLHEKLEADMRRDLYTKYKTAPTKEQQEAARQKYLDCVGMRESFRWS